jgi:hypothetical protein
VRQEIGEREFIFFLSLLVKAAGSQKAFAEQHNISYLSDVLKGRRKPGPSILRAVGYKTGTVYYYEGADNGNEGTDTR